MRRTNLTSTAANTNASTKSDARASSPRPGISAFASLFTAVPDRLATFLLGLGHPWLIAFILLAAVALRLTLALTHDSYLGIDGGAYILAAQDVLGEKAVSVGFTRPPLAPGWLLVPFLKLWGPDLGYKLWAVAASMPVLLPVYLLGRDLVSRPAGLFCLTFFSLDFMQLEMWVDGAAPILGFTFLGMAIWSIYRLTEAWSRIHFLILAGSIGIIPYINQTTAGLAAILLPILWVSLWRGLKADKPGPSLAGPYLANLICYILPALALGAVLAIPAAPWYLANMPGNNELRFPGPLLFPVSPLDTSVFQAIGVFMLCWWLWRRAKQVPEAAAEGLSRPDCRIRSAALLIAVMGVMGLFVSYDEAVINVIFRARWAMALLVYPVIAWLVCEHWPLGRWREDWLIYSALAAAFAALVGVYVWGFGEHTRYKDQVMPETAEALEIADREREGKAIITNFYSLSHWVAALNGVESPNAWALEPSPHYQESDKRVRCLLGWAAACDAGEAARELNAGYILIDRRFPELKMGQRIYGALEPEDPWGRMGDVPWLQLRYQGGKVSLWEINTGGSIEDFR